MGNILDAIEGLEDVRFIKPADPKQIENAQEVLGVTFAEDYKEYLGKYGVISAKGLELTGIAAVDRLNVVKVTQQERKMNKIMPTDMYVIENTAVDGIVALQNAEGKIYTITMDGKLEFFSTSLADYVNKAKL
ncbi:hypothetical protein C818_00225 [Lachnospiraceae bacterium MD308]|nr:hypothetical protein C818_00225 [Lachnospiraceae bacterium MD308]